MKTAATSVLICVGVLGAACVQKTIIPTSFTPAYKTMLDAADATVARSCAAASAVNAESSLSGTVVGKRKIEESSYPAQDIRIEGDTAAWLRASADEMFKRASLKAGIADAPSVTLKLADVLIDETVHVNSAYDARITVDAAVVNSRGKQCWSGRKTGASHEYGADGSAENYRPLVDHALDRAVMAVASDPGFQEALCSSSCRNAVPEPAASPARKRSKRHKP